MVLPVPAAVWATLFFLFVTSCSLAAPPALPLANVYEQGQPLEGYWISEKLDGVRALWDGRRFLSRSGYEYRAPAWFTERFPDHALDGELWMGRGRFAELSGAVRKSVPDDSEWQQVRFMVFDMPLPGVRFDQRLERLSEVVAKADSAYLAVVEQHRALTHDHLMARLDEVVAAGGEGLMLKLGSSHYNAGRSDDLLKVKPYFDDEAVVVRQLPGKGKYEGMMGALLVQLDNGRRFRIGSGFSDADRAAPPAPGTIITFKYHGYTVTGLPRFASFIRIRRDEPERPIRGDNP